MRRGSPYRFSAAGLVLCAVACASSVVPASAQADSSQTVQLLSNAHALEVRGRMDMAKQKWQQVLLIDANNTEALAGMARAAKTEGRQGEADEYLRRLRAINPKDPNITRAENTNTVQANSAQLGQAGRMAQQGQYAGAMAIQRQVYGNTPPPGDAAVGYYETEAATPGGSAHAVASLRGLAHQYPQDPRYEIALGKILTYNPRTRAEGRRLLAKYPNDAGAAEALQKALSWDTRRGGRTATATASRPIILPQGGSPQAPAGQVPAGQISAGQISARQQSAEQLSRGQIVLPQARSSYAESYPATRRAGKPAVHVAHSPRSAPGGAQTTEERAAYAALNAKRYAEAETLFKNILAKHPQSWRAQAGMGYLRMGQSNFAAAISFLEQAQQDGAKDPGVERALHDSRFYYTVQVATTALNDNDLFTADKQFELALKLRPGDSSALLGLGGTLLKAQQPEQAIPVFQQYAKGQPGDMKAWRGLMMAEFGAGKYNDALATDRRVPAPVKAQLVKDPDYLRTLASVYLAVGREDEAQRVFQLALNLPFPGGAQGMKVDVQLQYAALLATAGRREQAAGLYRQVLSADPANTSAWVGLIQVEHQRGRDAEAYQAIQSMPPQSYSAAMQEAGFETTVAAIYEASGRDDLAQTVLEQFLAKQSAEGKKPFVPAQVQLASIYIRRGNSAAAYPLYRAIIAANPDRADAWIGLLSALHSTEHDQEALAQAQQIPPAVRRELEQNPAYLQMVGSIYSGLGDPQQAMVFFNQVQRHYAGLHVDPPADIQIQQAWILYNSHIDSGLYHTLMTLGSRGDLTNRQRLEAQTIWTNFAVRRANQAAAAGNYRRSIAILNATAKSFPGNPTVIKALATGYASAGMAKEAVAIFRAQDMNAASSADYRAAVGAALAANDLKDAEIWLRFGLDRYPRDAQMLILAAKFEQARGDGGRAADFYRASLSAMPPVDPGAELAAELSRPAPLVPAQLPSAQQPQDLASLLAQPEDGAQRQMQMAIRPYLPSYNGPATGVPVPMVYGPGAGPDNGTEWKGSPQPGGQMGSPQISYPQPQTSAPASPSTLRDYVPQSRLDGEGTRPVDRTAAAVVLHLHPSREMEAKYGPYVTYDPSAGVPHFASARRALGDGVMVALSDVKESGTTAGFSVAAFAPQAGLQDNTPTVTYIPAARPGRARSKVNPANSTRAVSAQSSPGQETSSQSRARAIHLNQGTGQPAVSGQSMSGQSRPPADGLVPQDGSAAQLSNTQYFTSQQYSVPAGQVPPPQNTGRGQTPQGSAGYAPQTGTPYVQQTSPYTPGGVGDTYGQQYPPMGGGSGGTGRVRARKSSGTAAKPVAQTQGMQTQGDQPATPQAPANAPMQYPSTGQGNGNVGYPAIAAPYPLGQAPSDYDLQQRNLPPLRGYFDPRGEQRKPLSPREQAELALATIEGGYSGWVGGTAIGRYRSGTSGVDRLAALEVPMEVSLVAGKTFRFSIIPKAVFLNSGQLDTSGILGSAPILGTLPGNALVAPAPQSASGVGGEVQLATSTFSAAAGTTPWQFLVSNVIGRVRWRPANGHFTVFGGRDAVRQTQLSYAGLRDPGSASPVYGGNVWGGVVDTGGGARFDTGGERSGFYIQGEGGQLTGYHVLDNTRFAGTAGAYFRVNTWPEYGSLNIGGLFYGEHFAHNERGQTYGLGGYFSPEAYFLAAVPITFTGHNGNNLHYVVNSSLGVQTFQEDNQPYYPLDRALQTSAYSACTILQITQRTCGQMPTNSNTGLNYSFDTQVSYHVNDHWFVGAFLSANNTNNFNTVSGGFYARYLFKPIPAQVDYPTGLFPLEGFRPLQVP